MTVDVGEVSRVDTLVHPDPRPLSVAVAAPRLEPQPPGRFACCFPWVRDATVLASGLAGGMLFDARLGITDSISLNQVLGAATLGFVAVRLCTGGRFHLRDAQTLLLVAALTALLMVRAIDSPNPTYARFKVIGYLAMVLPLVAYLELHLRRPTDVMRWLRIVSLAGLALVVLGIPHMLSIEGGQRLAVLGGGPNTLARHIGTASIAAIVLLAIHRSRLRLWATSLGLALCGLALLLTGTKAVMLSLAVTSVYVLARLGRRRAVAIVMLGLVSLAVLPVVTHDFVRDQPKDGGLVRLLRLPDVDDPFGSYGSRLRFVSGTWHELQANPWVGVGTGGWGMQLDLGYAEAYPHSIVLEVLGETGLFGIAVLGCIIARWVRRQRPGPRSSAPQGSRALAVGLEGFVVFWGVNVLLSGDLVDSRYFWLWLCVWELYRRRMDRSCPSLA